MKERPVLFSAPMVRAILAGTKTQTRRVVKPQPTMRDGEPAWPIDAKRPRDRGFEDCPYGQPGDRLWVRETWQADPIIDDTWASTQWHGCPKDARIADLPERFHHPRFCNYKADWLHGDIRWRPSIFMPRWASRITLEVTDVRVERLQSISNADALAEGVVVHKDHHHKRTSHICSPYQAYRDLWESINGHGSWEANPWVWVVEFQRAP